MAIHVPALIVTLRSRYDNALEIQANSSSSSSTYCEYFKKTELSEPALAERFGVVSAAKLAQAPIGDDSISRAQIGGTHE
jgi:hypothetical protein